MTTYNGSVYLKQTIDAILEQTFADFELLIVDDGSSDETLDIIRTYRDARIRCLVNARNLGISASRNRALDEARGEFLAMTDQDDLSLPDRLAVQVQFLEQHPEIDLVSTAVDFLRDGKRWRDPMRPLDRPCLVHMGLFFGRHNVTYSSVCVRQTFLRRHHLFFDPAFHYAEDLDLYLRIAQVGRMVTLSSSLVIYRRHAHNTSVRQYLDMSRHGRCVLARAYRELLDRTLAEPEIERIWRVLVERHPATSLVELEQIAEVMTEVLTAFLKRAGMTEIECEALRNFAAEIWWSVVAVSSRRRLGSAALRLFEQPAILGQYPPPWIERGAAWLRVLISNWRRIA